MKKTVKLLMAIALTVMMTVTSIPVNTVFADDDVPVTTVTEQNEENEKTDDPADVPADDAGDDAGDAAAADPVPEVTEDTPEDSDPVPETDAIVLNEAPFSGEFQAGGLNVKVSYEAGTLPEGTTVVVGEAAPEALGALIAEKGEFGIKAVDISFVYNGEEIEPKDFSDKNVSVVLSFQGADNLGDFLFETAHVTETVNDDGTVTYGVDPVEAVMTDIVEIRTVPVEVERTETVTKYKDVDVYEDVEVPYEEEEPVYETREITEERTTYVEKTREVEKTRMVKVKVPFKWYDLSTWLGYKLVPETYTVIETYEEPVTETVVVGYEEVQVGTRKVTKYRTESQYVRTDTVEDGTEEVTVTETVYEDVEVVIGQTAEFSANDFSVYAVVATAFQNNQQYVIYTGTTALAYNGNNLTTATVTVENGTVVRSSSDNIVWTATQSGTNWRLYYTNGTGWQAQDRYLRRNNNTLETRNGGNNDCNVTYDNYNHRLTVGGRYLTYNNGTWGLTQTASQAATVYIALVGTEPVTGDLTYNYYNADHTASISTAETVADDHVTTWTNVSTLAKEIPGYQYLEARANSVDGDVITQVNGRAYRQGTETSGNGSTLNSIYFIYMRDYVAGEDVIPGLNGPITEKSVNHNSDGTFTITLDVTGVMNEVKHGANVVVVFDITSSMDGNMGGQGTAMRINAAISAVNTLVTKLNPGDPAQEGYYDIDFALVEFARTGSAYDFGSDGIANHTTWTKSGDALNTRVERYRNGANLAPSGATPGGGGTNWQAALQATAAVLEDKPDADPTYVIFMTDGEPTIYIGSNTVINNRSTTDPEYTRAVPYATAIVNADYQMYDIFCSAGTTTLLQSLYTESGAKSYVMAGSQAALEEAFGKVAEDMLDAIGSSNYGVDDGVPSMGSFDLATVDGVAQLSEARYYIKTADSDEFVLWADAPVAKPSDDGVLWDLSSVGTLAGDTVYRVEFEIWPSQAAYDLIADLNNQKIFYDFASYQAAGGTDYTTEEAAIAAGVVITAAQKAQITQVNATTYTMKTNTSLSATYKLYGQTIVDDDIDYTADAMDLPTETISVRKLWPENMLDQYGAAAYRTPDGKTEYATEIKLTLQRAGEDYLEVTVSKDGPDGNPDTKDDNWMVDDIYVSCGFMTVDANGVAHIKEAGHDYQIIEPESFLYYWDLISDVYHPMVINGTDTLLVLDVDATEADVDNVTYFAIGTNEDGTAKIYKKQANSENTLEASNYRRSNLNLYKILPSEAEDTYFTYTAKVTDSYSTDEYIWFSAFEPIVDENGDPVLDANGNVRSQVVYEDWVLSGATAETSTLTIGEGAASNVEYHEADDTHPYAYFSYVWNGGSTVYEVPAVNSDVTAPVYKTGYYYAPNGATVTFKVKAGWEDLSTKNWKSFPGWNVRFLNLYHESTFVFEETGMPGNYNFDSVITSTQYDIIHDVNKNWYTIDTESTTGKINGTITEPNNNFYVGYKNTPKPEFYIYHSGVAGDGNLETIIIPDDSATTTTGNWNGDGTYNLYAHATEGLLYGGYYLDYAGKGDYKDDGVKGTTGVAYTGMNYDWSDPQTVDGTKITPVAGETYYIKEVPTYYLRNYHQFNYVKTTDALTAFYLISAIDDLNYNETGMVLVSTDSRVAKAAKTMTYKNTATGTTVSLKANRVFKKVDGKDAITGTNSENEYLTYFETTNTDYFAPGSFTVQPYWITPDGITTKGVSIRTITIDSMTRTGVSKVDN